MNAPLVSVITPTWRRRDVLLSRCLPSVYAQTYLRVEHVVVSDGPDRELDVALANDLWRRPRDRRPLVYQWLGEHDDAPPVDYGSRARNRGLAVASGAFVAYLDDDNAYRPYHVEWLLTALLENPDADFAYSRLVTHPAGLVIGSEPPAYTQLDTSVIMHRAGVPQRLGMWPLPHELTGDQHAPDWGIVERWLRGGAKWVHVPHVTLDYWTA